MIYWRGINIGDWQFFRNFANINNCMDMPIKKTNSPNITLINKLSCTILKFELNCPVNRMYTLISVCSCTSFTKVKIVNHQHVVEPCGTLLNSLEKTHLYDNCSFLIDGYDQCIHVL